MTKMKCRLDLDFTVTNLCDSRKYTEPSPQQSMAPLLSELMTVKLRGASYNWNISLKVQDKSTLLQPPALPLMYACPLLSLGAHGSYLSLCGSSREATLPHRLTVGLPSLRESLASFLS